MNKYVPTDLLLTELIAAGRTATESSHPLYPHLRTPKTTQLETAVTSKKYLLSIYDHQCHQWQASL